MSGIVPFCSLHALMTLPLSFPGQRVQEDETIGTEASLGDARRRGQSLALLGFNSPVVEGGVGELGTLRPHKSSPSSPPAQAVFWDVTGHENRWRMAWDFIMLGTFLYIVIVTPYLIAFNIQQVRRG